MSEVPENRLRPHPEVRFAGDTHVFDLNAALQKLRAEAHDGQSGHRQMTLSHRAPVAQILFAFEPQGELADHAAAGLVTIQVLEGQITAQAEGQDHELGANMLIILAPHVRHSVRATEKSALLLMVHLENAP